MAGLGLAAVASLLLLPSAQACGAGCAIASQPVAMESCPGGCIQVPRLFRGVQYSLNGNQMVFDGEGVCAGVYVGYQPFPGSYELRGGVIVRVHDDASYHYAFGSGQYTC